MTTTTDLIETYLLVQADRANALNADDQHRASFAAEALEILTIAIRESLLADA